MTDELFSGDKIPAPTSVVAHLTAGWLARQTEAAVCDPGYIKVDLVLRNNSVLSLSSYVSCGKLRNWSGFLHLYAVDGSMAVVTLRSPDRDIVAAALLDLWRRIQSGDQVVCQSEDQISALKMLERML